MIEYSEDWLLPLIFRLNGSLSCRSSLFAIPAALLALFLVSVDDLIPNFRESLGILDVDKSQLWTATTLVLGIMLGFRTNRAMSRFWEGTGLLHQMRGEWFDSVSCCVTFSRAAQNTHADDVEKFRHTIVRLMSLCHGSALEEIAGDQGDGIETIDAYGLDNATLIYLRDCKETLRFNRVEVLLHLTQSIITKALDDGVLKIPPPILSRVYQTLSRGFVNLLNAKKIADTRFPFPFAQIITILLLVHVIMTPVMLSCLISSRIWAPIFTFVPIFGMFYLDFVGVELENPFGKDANDLPLEHFQSEMNNCLLMLLHDKADLIATVSDERCVMHFPTLQESLSLAMEEVGRFRAPSDRSSMDSKILRSRSLARISMFSFEEIEEEVQRTEPAHRSTTHLVEINEKLTERPDVELVECPDNQEPQRHATVCSGHTVIGGEESADLRVAVAQMGEQARESSSQSAKETLDAALFLCSVEPCPEPTHPLVQVEVPKRAGRNDVGLALEVANDLLREMRPASPAKLQARLDGPDPCSASRSLLQDQMQARREAAREASARKDPLAPSMVPFHEALQQWTQLIEDQLHELRQNVVGMKRFSETVDALQHSTRLWK